jgi:hypothetical protein
MIMDSNHGKLIDAYSIAYRQPDPSVEKYDYAEDDRRNPNRFVYSRESQTISTRVEHILSKINVSAGMISAFLYNVKLGPSARICLDILVWTCFEPRSMSLLTFKLEDYL